MTFVYFWSKPDRMGRWGFKTLFKLSIFLRFLVFFLNILFRNFFIQLDLHSPTSLIRQSNKGIVYFQTPFLKSLIHRKMPFKSVL